jgi:hypothetical protein
VHHLLDFGDSFGSDSDIAKDPRHGQEYIVLPMTWSRMYSFGLHPADWETVHYPQEMKAVGNFTAAAFDPLAWKANYPNPAFVQLTPLDGYWAAKRVMAFRDEQIRAIVEEGQFQDPKVVDYITRVLEARRDAIGRAWFRQVLPLEGFRIVDDHLAFDDLAVQHGFAPPSRYQLSWFVWHNEAQRKDEVSTSEGLALPTTLKSLAVGLYWLQDRTRAYRQEIGHSLLPPGRRRLEARRHLANNSLRKIRRRAAWLAQRPGATLFKAEASA